MRGSQQNKSVEVFAKSVYRELKSNGYSRDQIVAFTSQMIELLTQDVREPAASADAAESAA